MNIGVVQPADAGGSERMPKPASPRAQTGNAAGFDAVLASGEETTASAGPEPDESGRADQLPTPLNGVGYLVERQLLPDAATASPANEAAGGTGPLEIPADGAGDDVEAASAAPPPPVAIARPEGCWIAEMLVGDNFGREQASAGAGSLQVFKHPAAQDAGVTRAGNSELPASAPKVMAPIPAVTGEVILPPAPQPLALSAAMPAAVDSPLGRDRQVQVPSPTEILQPLSSSEPLVLLTDKPITLGRETGDGRYGVPPANAEVKADRFIELKPLQPALPAKESVVVGDRLSLIHRAMPAPVVSDARALGRAQDASTTSTKAAVSKPGGEAGKLIEVPGNPPLLGPAGAADAARPAAKLLAQVAALDAQDRRPAADPASPPQRFPFTVQDRGGDAGKQSGRLTTPRQAARTAEKASELGVQPAAVPASVTGGGKVSTPSKLEDVLLARAETRPGAANAAPSPAVLLAPAEQILSHVSGEAPGLTGKTHHSGAGFLADAGPGGRTGMTVLRLRLQPETLGDVEVTLRRRSTDVVVHISVNSEETARTLQQDVALLQDRLGLALSGEAVAAVQISVRDQPAQTPNQPMAGSGQSSGFAAPSGGEPGSDRRPPPGTNEHLFAPEKSDDDKEAGRTGNRDTGLVV